MGVENEDLDFIVTSVFCSVHSSSCPGFLVWTPGLVNSGRLLGLFGFPLPADWKLSRQSAGAIVGFFSHGPELPIVCSFIYVVQLFRYLRVTSFLITPSWLKVEISNVNVVRSVVCLTKGAETTEYPSGTN